MSDYTTSVFMPVLNRRLLSEAPRIRCHVENLGPDSLTKVDRGLADFCITVQERELLDDQRVVVVQVRRELRELEPSFREWNAHLQAEGRLVPDIARL